MEKNIKLFFLLIICIFSLDCQSQLNQINPAIDLHFQITNNYIIGFSNMSEIRNYIINRNIKKFTSIRQQEKKDSSGLTHLDTTFINTIIYDKSKNIIIDSNIEIDFYTGNRAITSYRYLFNDSILVNEKYNCSNNIYDSSAYERFYYYNKNKTINKIIELSQLGHDTTSIKNYYYDRKGRISEFLKIKVNRVCNKKSNKVDTIKYLIKYSNNKIVVIIQNKISEIYQLNNQGKLIEYISVYDEDNYFKNNVDTTKIEYNYSKDLVFIQGYENDRCWRIFYLFDKENLVSRNSYHFEPCGSELYINNDIEFIYDKNKFLKHSSHLLFNYPSDIQVSNVEYYFEFYN
jgi:hypothetical protein